MVVQSMNVELLRKVQKHILEEPLRVDMGNWRIDGKFRLESLGVKPEKIPACGTIACIAGWADLLANGRLDEDLIFARAIGALAIDDNQADILFHDDEWPADLYYEPYESQPGTKEYAACVSRRIDRFIETGGQE